MDEKKSNMKLVYFGNGVRAVTCLKALFDNGFNIELIVGKAGETLDDSSVTGLAKINGIKFITPNNPNDIESESVIREAEPDLCVLGGYGKILKDNIINIPKIMCINLHGGKLPEYRGSSPLNWALINDEKTFGISIVKVDIGVDTGELIDERIFDIGPEDTIVELHKKANEAFPEMLVKVIKSIEENTFALKKYDRLSGSYFPLRFEEDGFILFDLFTAKEVYNKIRALTTPSTYAYSYYKGKKIKFISAKFSKLPYYGEPGRVYLKSSNGLLVCCKDKCVWISKAVIEGSGEDPFEIIERYSSFSTIRGQILKSLKG